MVDFDEILNGPLLETFGFPGTVHPADGGEAFSLTLALTRNVVAEDLGQRLGAASSEVTLFYRESALPKGRVVRQGDVVHFESRGRIDTVTVAQPPDVDETGWAALAVYRGEVSLDD